MPVSRSVDQTPCQEMSGYEEPVSNGLSLPLTDPGCRDHDLGYLEVQGGEAEEEVELYEDLDNVVNDNISNLVSVFHIKL